MRVSSRTDEIVSVAEALMPIDTESPMYATLVHAVLVGAERTVVDVRVAADDVAGIVFARGETGGVEDGSTTVGALGRLGIGPS